MSGSPLDFCRKKYFSFSVDVLGILFLSFFLHFFTLNWELPHIVSPEVDGIPPAPGMTAEAMCRYETHKYPILQYILAEKSAEIFLDPLPADVKFSYTSPDERVWNVVSKRVLLFRFLSALMGTLAALLLYFMARAFLACSRPGALLGAAMLLFPPAVLHYSHTTNMDMPGLFWCTALLFTLLYREKKEKEGAGKNLLLPLSFLSGVLLACAFSTKDQIYAVMILPFCFFLYRKIREKKSFIPTILSWGAGFFLMELFIWFWLCRDREIFLHHFKWLVTSGSDAAVFAFVSKSLLGYTRLLFRNFYDMASAFDWGFLFFLVGGGGLLLYISRKEKKPLESKIKLLLIFTGLAFLSHYLFFSMVVRYNYPRYMLTLLPLFALLAGMIFDGLFAEKRKFTVIFTVFLLLFLSGQSLEYLFLLENTPRTLARNEVKNWQQNENAVFTSLSRRDIRLSRESGTGKILSRSTIRDWSYSLGLKLYGIKDLPAESLHFYLFEPQWILAESFPAEKFTFEKRFSFPVVPHVLPRLFPASFPELNLYSSTEFSGRELLAAFRQEPLSWQLVLLHNAFSKRPIVSKEKARNIGKNLAAFSEKEVKEELFDIPKSSLFLARDLYSLAGRKEDAGKVHRYLQKRGF